MSLITSDKEPILKQLRGVEDLGEARLKEGLPHLDAGIEALDEGAVDPLRQNGAPRLRVAVARRQLDDLGADLGG